MFITYIKKKRLIKISFLILHIIRMKLLKSLASGNLAGREAKKPMRLLLLLLIGVDCGNNS